MGNTWGDGKWNAEAFDRWLTTEPDYEAYLAPCGAEVYGTPRDIDSGLRRHIDYCGPCQEIMDTQEEPDDNGPW